MHGVKQTSSASGPKPLWRLSADNIAAPSTSAYRWVAETGARVALSYMIRCFRRSPGLGHQLAAYRTLRFVVPKDSAFRRPSKTDTALNQRIFEVVVEAGGEWPKRIVAVAFPNDGLGGRIAGKCPYGQPTWIRPQ